MAYLRRVGWLIVLTIVAMVATVAMAAEAPRGAAVDEDFITQAGARAVAAAQSAGRVSTVEDAAGGCDGIKDGKWGFHTDMPATASWWQVDLGSIQKLARVVLYNRCDMPHRTDRLEILLSDDGQSWRQAYRHNGQPFCGFTDNKPLCVAMNGAAGRFVRLQVPAHTYLHLDEVEVYGCDDPQKNIALHRPADQSSVSQWSARHAANEAAASYPIAQAIDRGRKLAADLAGAGVDVADAQRELNAIESASGAKDADARALYLRACNSARKLALANPLIDFDRILFVKRVPGTYNHVSDQYYSWWSRPGGGIFMLENFKSDAPTTRCLTESFGPGSFLSPDLSYDGKRVLFSYCKFQPGRREMQDKVNKGPQEEASFYHVFEMNIDGSNVRQITHGKYDDIFPRYLPDGRIVLLSTRRGTALQCNAASVQASLTTCVPDSYVRCGGGPSRPVAIYTLHTMDASGGNWTPISAFESFEWDPSVAEDGSIFYARWDYVDRTNQPYMKLWSTRPDGTMARAVYGNYTSNPIGTFEPRSIPGSRKIIVTASAHHAQTGGSLVLLDPTLGISDGAAPITRLTPEVCFPESEGWPTSWYANPYPLSERYFLCAWAKPMKLMHEGKASHENAMGVYLYDAFGNLQLLYRDPAISCMYPLPVRARSAAPAVYAQSDPQAAQEGCCLVQDVYAGLDGIARGAVKRLRVVAMPIKTQPTMNSPSIGVTREDPGKCVLGTVPVEADGSAYFRVPSGVAVFFQALDEQGRSIQTMRSLTYVQPGQTASCVGCHEGRNLAPAPTARPMAVSRQPSRLSPGPQGSWPLSFDALVQPVLDQACVSCHQVKSSDAAAAKFDLKGAGWQSLVSYGHPSLAEQVRAAHFAGRSTAGQQPSTISPLMKVLEQPGGHHGVKLTEAARERLILWMDTYAQRSGHFSPQQEAALQAFREQIGGVMEK